MAIELDATKHADHGPMGYNGYAHEQLTAAFNLVQDPGGWKLPIDHVLDNPTEAQCDLVLTAVRFFAGCNAGFTPLAGGKVRVRAVGYYRAIGA